MAGSAVSSDSLTWKGTLFLALLALQFGSQPCLVKEFMPEHLGVNKASYVLTAELIKFLISFGMLAVGGELRKAFTGWTLWSSLAAAGAPAMVYAVQNVMIQISLQNLDGLTFNLLNQSKTIFTAVALFLIMGRKQSLPQVAALLGLLGASVVLSGGGISISTTQAVEHSDVFYLGIIPCLAASMLSGLASGLSQFTLQTGNRNSFVFTMELCVYSSLTLLVSLLFSSDGEIIAKRGFFAGWNTMVLIPVLTNGVGGIMVGLVMKYAGGVRKGFAIIIGILITGLIQRMLYETPLTNEMLLALPIVLVSTLVHIRNPYIELQKDVKKSQ